MRTAYDYKPLFRTVERVDLPCHYGEAVFELVDGGGYRLVGIRDNGEMMAPEILSRIAKGDAWNALAFWVRSGSEGIP